MGTCIVPGIFLAIFPKKYDFNKALGPKNGGRPKKKLTNSVHIIAIIPLKKFSGEHDFGTLEA